MQLDIDNIEFRGAAVAWLAGLDDATLADFAAVVAVSAGFYPTTLFSLWKEEVARRGLRHTRPLPQQRSNSADRLPAGHPLDFDWRFTDETSHALLRRAVTTTQSGNCIAHLGTPSTFRHGCRHYRNRQHLLVEQNTATTVALASERNASGTILNLDLTEIHKLPVVRAKAAILDPPWYPAETAVFLAAAARVCEVGAHIWLCQPTPATRPDVLSERAAVERDVARFGLELRFVEPSSVRYATPHFEAMSLRTLIEEFAIPSDWRTGDLLLFEKVRHADVSVQFPPKESDWQRASFGPVTLRARAAGGRDLGKLVPGDVLSSVSRRDPIRARIGLWTSGNRVFTLTSVESIVRLIELCDNDLTAKRFSWASTRGHARGIGVSPQVATKLFDVLLVEWQEHLTSLEQPWSTKL